MKLEDAAIKSKVINEEECLTIKEFISKLKTAKNLSMDMYANTKLVCSGKVSLITDNHWLIAAATAQMALIKSVSVNSIVVRIRQDSNVLFESITKCSTVIPANDVYVSAYVRLINDSPDNDLVKRISETTFRSQHTSRLDKVDFDSIESTLNDGVNVFGISDVFEMS